MGVKRLYTPKRLKSDLKGGKPFISDIPYLFKSFFHLLPISWPLFA